MLSLFTNFWTHCCIFFGPIAVSRFSSIIIIGLLILVQSLSHVRLFVTPWTAAHQTSLSFTISWSLLKLLSIELMKPSNHLILCHPLLLPSIFPSIRVFSNESVLCIRLSQSIGASASVLPVNIQGWFSLGLTGLISLLFKGLSRVFSSISLTPFEAGCHLFSNLLLNGISKFRTSASQSPAWTLKWLPHATVYNLQGPIRADLSRFLSFIPTTLHPQATKRHKVKYSLF